MSRFAGRLQMLFRRYGDADHCRLVQKLCKAQRRVRAQQRHTFRVLLG